MLTGEAGRVLGAFIHDRLSLLAEAASIEEALIACEYLTGPREELDDLQRRNSAVCTAVRAQLFSALRLYEPLENIH